MRRWLLLPLVVLVGCGGGGSTTSSSSVKVPGIFDGVLRAGTTNLGTAHAVVDDGGSMTVRIESASSGAPELITGQFSGPEFVGTIFYPNGASEQIRGEATDQGSNRIIDMPEFGLSLRMGRPAWGGVYDVTCTTTQGGILPAGDTVVGGNRAFTVRLSDDSRLTGSFTEGGHFTGRLESNGEATDLTGDLKDYRGLNYAQFITSGSLGGHTTFYVTFDKR